MTTSKGEGLAVRLAYTQVTAPREYLPLAPRTTENREMALIANVLTAVVGVLHLYFLVLEMFLWTRPAGRRVFRTTPEFAQASASLAANQGLYNGFLAAGLLWGLSLGANGYAIKLFFLACVVVAGLFGAVTVNKRIVLVQALPGAAAMALTVLARG